MRRKLISMFVMVLILLMIPITALAAEDFNPNAVGSVSITLVEQDGKTPISGVEFSLYYVASVKLNSNNNLNYKFVDAFKDCGFELDDPELSKKLDDSVKNKTAVSVLKTDAQGKAVFANLPLGLYFVKQTNSVDGYAPCTSFLVTVPSQSTNGFAYDVNAAPKTDIQRLTDITIEKKWNTGKSTQKADSVTVQLLCDGVVVQTATLNQSNNWIITYEDMPVSDKYSVLEVNIPKGFTATYSQTGYAFTVTNTSALAQTGQLVWPIPVFALAGLVFIAIGAVVIRKSRDNNA